MKAIVIYYSYSGNTKNIALHIAEALNADTAVIDTVKAYEGDYDAVVEQGHDEIRKGFRPPIKPINVDLSQYDTIILGTPVWWVHIRTCSKDIYRKQQSRRKNNISFCHKRRLDRSYAKGYCCRM